MFQLSRQQDNISSSLKTKYENFISLNHPDLGSIQPEKEALASFLDSARSQSGCDGDVRNPAFTMLPRLSPVSQYGGWARVTVTETVTEVRDILKHTRYKLIRLFGTNIGSWRCSCLPNRGHHPKMFIYSTAYSHQKCSSRGVGGCKWAPVLWRLVLSFLALAFLVFALTTFSPPCPHLHLCASSPRTAKIKRAWLWGHRLTPRAEYICSRWKQELPDKLRRKKERCSSSKKWSERDWGTGLCHPHKRYRIGTGSALCRWAGVITRQGKVNRAIQSIKCKCRCRCTINCSKLLVWSGYRAATPPCSVAKARTLPHTATATDGSW